MKTFVTFFLFYFPFCLYAQNGVINGCHNYRKGDKVSLIEVSGVATDYNGENVVWDFSGISSCNQHRDIEYTADYENNDLIAKVSENARFYFEQDTSAIRFVRYESNTMMEKYDCPVVVVTFPLVFGNKQNGIFHGMGTCSETLMLRLCGKYSTNVDAVGTLLMSGGERIDNVCRVHIVKETCCIPYTWIKSEMELRKYVTEMRPFNADSIDECLQDNIGSVSVTEAYLWYAEGYRYPIVETYVYGKDKTCRRTFLCPPSEQRKLHDTDNEKIRELLESNRNSDMDKASKGPNPAMPYHISQNGTLLSIVFESSLTDYVKCILSSSSGIVYSRSDGSGQKSVTLDCSGLLPGEYIIKVYIGEKMFSSTFHYKQ